MSAELPLSAKIKKTNTISFLGPFVTIILIGWHRNFHGIKSMFDATSENAHGSTLIPYFKKC